jgi:hypothetical protein
MSKHTYNQTCDVCGHLCAMPVCLACDGGPCLGVQEDPKGITTSMLTKRLKAWASERVDDVPAIKKAAGFMDVTIPAGRPLVDEDFSLDGAKPAFLELDPYSAVEEDFSAAGGPADGGAFNDRYPERDDLPMTDKGKWQSGPPPMPMVTLALAERQQECIEHAVKLIDKQQQFIDRLLRDIDRLNKPDVSPGGFRVEMS